ncbi:MAG TPA: S9 family peptidase, partial [Polyangiaceae bacterium]|nr:S9 family peptidase [Polyangiaceae bacterium]
MTAAVPSRREAIVETLHGVPVADPYRWLEDGTAPEVKSWVAAQNTLTDETLARVPEREALHERLTQLLAIGTISLPVVRRTRGGQLRLFFTRRSGPQDQPVLYVRDGLRGQDRTLVDPNRETSDGTTSLDWYDPSPDGSMLAYGTSQGGTEDSTLRVREVATSRDLPDRIERTRFASVAWSVDARSFFYTRYPRPGSVP